MVTSSRLRFAVGSALVVGAFAAWTLLSRTPDITPGIATAQAAERVMRVPAAELDNPKAAGPLQTAVLAGGCFWGMQGVFEHVHGVHQVVSGYSGGAKATANYDTVSTGTTGHAESVQITFDPKLVSYGELLRVYFSVATDPTELDRQGPDEGTQYRGDIFYANTTQQRIAEAYIAQLQHAHVYNGPIVTRVDALSGFYPAETYHQDFLVKNPTYPYIVINDLPKIANLKRLFATQYRVRPVLVAGTQVAAR